MSKTKPSLTEHTPGPWVFEKVDVDDGGHKFVAHLSHPHRASDRVEVYREPNKNLIEAAPDLLAVMKYLAEEVATDGRMVGWTSSILDKMKTVIAKAEGRKVGS